MKTGTVKWLNREKGFVLVRPHDGCLDVLIHFTAIEGGAAGDLKLGQIVVFETQRDFSTEEVNFRGPAH